MEVCEFCKSTFTTKAILARHKRRALYCLQLQGMKKDQQCKWCSRIFTRGSSLTRHMTKCPMASKSDSLENKLSELQEQIKQLTTDQRSMVVNGLQPITEEQIRNGVGNLTIELILEGARGFADFADKYSFKNKVLCTDKSRKKLQFRDEHGIIVKDGGGHKLMTKFFQAIASRNEELINDEYDTLQRKVAAIAKGGTANIVNLSELLTKATKLQEILQQCKDAAEGKENELTQEFIRHYVKIL